MVQLFMAADRLHRIGITPTVGGGPVMADGKVSPDLCRRRVDYGLSRADTGLDQRAVPALE